MNQTLSSHGLALFPITVVALIAYSRFFFFCVCVCVWQGSLVQTRTRNDFLLSFWGVFLNCFTAAFLLVRCFVRKHTWKTTFPRSLHMLSVSCGARTSHFLWRLVILLAFKSAVSVKPSHSPGKRERESFCPQPKHLREVFSVFFKKSAHSLYCWCHCCCSRCVSTHKSVSLPRLFSVLTSFQKAVLLYHEEFSLLPSGVSLWLSCDVSLLFLLH